MSLLNISEAKQVWQTKDIAVADDILWPPLIAQGAVILVDANSSLVRLSTDDGHIVWEMPSPNDATLRLQLPFYIKGKLV